jgi:hypothetical protein
MIQDVLLSPVPGNGATLAAEAVPVSPASAESTSARLAHTLTLFWLLRLACVCEYLGHGAFGIITKAAWVPYYGVVGIPESWAYRLMPVTGSVDIFLGFLVLLKPIRAALLYMAVWGLCTALLRPLSGEPFWETIERAPNYLVPAALLYLRGLPADWWDLREWLR